MGKITKEVFAKVRSKLEWLKMVTSGYKNLNGAWVNVRRLKLKRVDDNTYIASGVFHYGIQDMGDGCSETYTENFEKVEVKI